MLQAYDDKRIFMGFFSLSKAFWVYNIKRKILEESNNVNFDEESLPNSSIDEKQSQLPQELTQSTSTTDSLIMNNSDSTINPKISLIFI